MVAGMGKIVGRERAYAPTADAGTNIVVSGTCYGLRKECFSELPLEVGEDLANPLAVTAKRKRVVFDPTIVVEEWSNVDHAAEARMRLRVANQNITALVRFWRLFNPKYGLAAYQFLVHKGLRALCWSFLIAAFFLNLMLLGHPIMQAEDMPALAADSFSIAFGDFARGYLIVDRMGVRMLRDPFSSKGSVQFYTTKRVGADVIDFDSIKLLKFGTS